MKEFAASAEDVASVAMSETIFPTSALCTAASLSFFPPSSSPPFAPFPFPFRFASLATTPEISFLTSVFSYILPINSPCARMAARRE